MRNCKENEGSVDIQNAATYHTIDRIMLPARNATQ